MTLPAELRRRWAGVLDDSVCTRALYTCDASLYRVEPLAVARVHSRDQLAELVADLIAAGISITGRGAGTSCAGNAVGPGVIIDLRDLNTIISVDPEHAEAVVEPGLVLADLNRTLASHGLRFGPDPSTASRCTIGGMIGNNACGPRALGYGRTSDNVVGWELIRADGVVTHDARHWEKLRQMIAANLGVVRTEFGTFSRQVSGYSLEHLLPEKRHNIAPFLVGTEGTLGLISQATLTLAKAPAHTALVALGFASMADAADAVPGTLTYSPTACEGLDDRIVDVVRHRFGAFAVPDLPRGRGYLIMEVAGADLDEVLTRGRALGVAADALDFRVVTGAEAAALWKIRADGAGFAAVALDRMGLAGWEDAAVPCDRLGAYLRAFDQLLGEHRLQALPYGHFGEGCVHARITFDLDGSAGAQRYREFVWAAAEMAAGFGGSMSGEHGDGRARSELLPLMYSPQAVALFAAIKHAYDPANLFNPGVLVDPAPLDADLRRFSGAGGAHHRCTGVGACVSHQPGSTMCPSFRATGQEIDSTRGRARILQEAADGRLIIGGLAAPEVAEALDNCLACKACRSECPTGVDMSWLKSQALSARYADKRRPLSHYVLGWLPMWLRLSRRIPGFAGVANAVLRRSWMRRVIGKIVGMSNQRMPVFASNKQRARVLASLNMASLGVSASDSPSADAPHLATPEHASEERAGSAGHDAQRGALTAVSAARVGGAQSHPSLSSSAERPPRIVIWADSFTPSFSPQMIAATQMVLQDAGCRVDLLAEDVCCGLTWITTGQLDGARTRLRHALDVLHPLVEAGAVIVGIEPSCTSVWRSDAAELLPDDPRVLVVAGAVKTVAEVLVEQDWQPPDLAGHMIVAQPHCHQRSVIGWTADAALLRRAGAELITVDGCCGMAGNFGMEKDHETLSAAVAELNLLPALREHPDAIILADGFSCRTQITRLSDQHPISLAELLASHLR